jgi:hypothetical protein
MTHDLTSEHYPRQREAFYSAEALRLFARDSVPAGTFEALQADLYDGVVEVCEGDGPAMERLQRVLAAAAQAQVTSSPLLSVLYLRDRKGICHQLANEDRLLWVKP